MLVEHLALTIAALFTGGAFFANVVEHPARLHLDDAGMLTQWKPAYKRGFALQAPMATLGFALGTWAWWQSGDPLLLIGGLLLIANWPFTLIWIMPINRKLLATAPGQAGSDTRALLEKWAAFHGVRTGLGAGAILAFLWASLR